MYVARIHGNGAKKKLAKLFYRTPYTVSDSSQNFFVDFKHTSLVADDKRVKNSVALVRERTIPTERPPLVGEVSGNLCGQRGVAWSVQRIPTAVFSSFETGAAIVSSK
jgi:hypothetical protein